MKILKGLYLMNITYFISNG